MAFHIRVRLHCQHCGCDFDYESRDPYEIASCRDCGSLDLADMASSERLTPEPTDDLARARARRALEGSSILSKPWRRR